MNGYKRRATVGPLFFWDRMSEDSPFGKITKKRNRTEGKTHIR